jgi:hypothetical protein
MLPPPRWPFSALPLFAAITLPPRHFAFAFRLPPSPPLLRLPLRFHCIIFADIIAIFEIFRCMMLFRRQFSLSIFATPPPPFSADDAAAATPCRFSPR